MNGSLPIPMAVTVYHTVPMISNYSVNSILTSYNYSVSLADDMLDIRPIVVNDIFAMFGKMQSNDMKISVTMFCQKTSGRHQPKGYPISAHKKLPQISTHLHNSISQSQ